MFTDIICALKVNTPQQHTFVLFSDIICANKLEGIVHMIIVKMDFRNIALLSILYFQS